MDAPNFDHNSKLFSSAISLEKGSSSNRLGLICGTGGEPARPKDDYFCSTEKIAISSSSINIMIFYATQSIARYKNKPLEKISETRS